MGLAGESALLYFVHFEQLNRSQSHVYTCLLLFSTRENIQIYHQIFNISWKQPLLQYTKALNISKSLGSCMKECHIHVHSWLDWGLVSQGRASLSLDPHPTYLECWLVLGHKKWRLPSKILTSPYTPVSFCQPWLCVLQLFVGWELGFLACVLSALGPASHANLTATQPFSSLLISHVSQVTWSSATQILEKTEKICLATCFVLAGYCPPLSPVPGQPIGNTCY